MKVCSRCGHIYDDEHEMCPQCSVKNKVCRNCGAQNAPNAKFCISCGEKFDVKRICACGAKNPEDSTTCYACGRPLDEPLSLPKIKKVHWIPIAVAIVSAIVILALICLFI